MKKAKTYGDSINERVNDWKEMVAADLRDKKNGERSQFNWASLMKTQLKMEIFVAERALEKIEELEKEVAQ